MSRNKVGSLMWTFPHESNTRGRAHPAVRLEQAPRGFPGWATQNLLDIVEHIKHGHAGRDERISWSQALVTWWCSWYPGMETLLVFAF